MPTQQLSGGDGLDGLTRPHFIPDQGAFDLVRIQLYLEQTRQFRAIDSERSSA